MKIDGKEIARANMARRAENKKDSDEASHEVAGEIQEQGAHIKAMYNFIEAIHNKEPEEAHKHMMSYADAYSKMKSE